MRPCRCAQRPWSCHGEQHVLACLCAPWQAAGPITCHTAMPVVMCPAHGDRRGSDGGPHATALPGHARRRRHRRRGDQAVQRAPLACLRSLQGSGGLRAALAPRWRQPCPPWTVGPSRTGQSSGTGSCHGIRMRTGTTAPQRRWDQRADDVPRAVIPIARIGAGATQRPPARTVLRVTRDASSAPARYAVERPPKRSSWDGPPPALALSRRRISHAANTTARRGMLYTGSAAATIAGALPPTVPPAAALPP